MTDFEILKSKCDEYEDHCSKQPNFHVLAYCDKFEKYVTSLFVGLKWVGSGMCCQVLSLGDWVVKFYYPGGEHNLLSNPSRKDYGEAVNAGWESHPRFGDTEDMAHFLFMEYVTKNGFAGIQKKVKCRINFGDHPLVRKFSTQNLGLDGDKVVIVDWY